MMIAVLSGCIAFPSRRTLDPVSLRVVALHGSPLTNVMALAACRKYIMGVGLAGSHGVPTKQYYFYTFADTTGRVQMPQTSFWYLRCDVLCGDGYVSNPEIYIIADTNEFRVETNTSNSELPRQITVEDFGNMTCEARCETPIELVPLRRGDEARFQVLEHRLPFTGIKRYVTTLHDALETRNVAVVKLLLDRGADPNTGNIPGALVGGWPLQMATYYYPNAEIARLLIQHGAK